MSKMNDTEGERIPSSDHGEISYFDLALWGDGLMMMSVPAFETRSGNYSARGGVLQVSLRDIFEDYLVNGRRLDRGSDEPISLANLLREYADKFEASSELEELLKSSSKENPILSDHEIKTIEIASAMILLSSKNPLSIN
jgi:hypothetical protein